MIEIGDSEVKQMQIGETPIYINGGDWIQLDLTKVALDGSVFFHDNGNGTASLVGSARYDFSKKTYQTVPILLPPDGYVFSGVDWTCGPADNGLMASRGVSGSSSGVGVVHSVRVEDGKVLLDTGGSDDEYSVFVTFSCNRTVKSAAEASPAIVSIEKVKES